MDSLFSNLFLSLETLIEEKAPLIKGVYPELSQTENYNGAPSQWPCLFIDFTNLAYAELTGYAQAVSGELQCRLVTQITVADGITFLDTPTALACYEAELQMHRALQGWTNGAIAPLTRIKTITEDRGDAFRIRALTTVDKHDAFRVRVLTYSLNFNEYPVPAATSEIPTPPLDMRP